jgi:hypothetical protein
VATEVKYSIVFEEVIEGIKSTPSREMHEAYHCPLARIEENENEKKMCGGLPMQPVEEAAVGGFDEQEVSGSESQN